MPHTSLNLAPLAGVERIGAMLDASRWRSFSDDPQLLSEGALPGDGSEALLFEVDVLAIEGGGGVPCLYFDFGDGFKGENGISMQRSEPGRRPYSVAVRLGVRPERIRFDPCSAPGEFLCSDLIVSTIPAAREARSGAIATLPGGGAALPRRDSLATRAARLQPAQRVGAIVHLHYEELWPELAEYLRNIPTLDRLYVSIAANADPQLEQRIAAEFPQALARRVPNRGRDVLPFLQWLEVAALHGIDVVCKIHSKRSPHVAAGTAWRRDMIDKLLGSPAVVHAVLSTLQANPRVGIVGPGGHVVPSSYYWEHNAPRVDQLSRRLGREAQGAPFDYVAGSMFWARIEALLPLRRLALRDEDFDGESGAVDGTLHHALERVFPIAAEIAGFEVAETANESGKTVHDFAPPPPAAQTYREWIAKYEPPEEDYGSFAAAERQWKDAPLISVILPTYQPRREDLAAAIDSVIAQVYPNWELCIADDASRAPHVRELLDGYAARDPRIKVHYRAANGHISAASNSALAMATGEFSALLDHDDALHPLALHFVAEAIVRDSKVQMVYTDEDKLGLDGARQDPYFKCDLNPELLLAHNMICHLGCYRTSRLRELGGFREGFEGAQDYDLALRFIEGLDPAQVVHVPRVLYHWRVSKGSTAMASDEKPYAQLAARKAIAEHLERTGTRGEVLPAGEAPGMNRVRYALPQEQPSVAIIIPTRDRADLVAMCAYSVLDRSTYRNYSVVIVDNGSVEHATMELFERLRKRGVKVLRDESEFNFSALNNRAVKATEADYVCLLNNDIEILTPDWIEEMVSFAQRPGVGAVGARLWYPDGRLQHGGVIVGVGGVAGHSHKYLPRGHRGYFARAVLHQALTAVTAACLLIRRETYLKVGGLDETLKVAFNDIDFCLKVHAAGFRNVWTPYAEMVHHESASRGHETSPEKQARFNGEVLRMMERWGESLRQDPAYSPNLTLEHEDFSLAWPPRVADN